jgi:hypothetical protein
MDRLLNDPLNVVPDRVESCIAGQLGRIAKRNSCRNPWTYSLNLRASLRPNLPQVQRRLTISIDASNVLTGLDELIHGSDDMRGWGESQNSESRLLQVHGFDPATNGFIYEVNEDFGQQRRGQSAIRSPFSLRISGRLAVGGQAFQNNRGFGPPIALTTGTGGPGNFGDGFGGRGDGPGGGGGLGDLGPLLRANADANVDSLVALVLPNPTIAVLGMKDSLKLTEPQIQKVTALSAELQTQLEARRATLARVAKEMNLTTIAANLRAAQQQNGGGNADNGRAQNGGNGGFGGGRGGRGGGGGFGGGGRGGVQGLDPQLIQRIQLEITPTIEGARRESTQTMAQVQRELTPEQWQKIPARLRGQGGRGGGGFNAVGMLDRMLANPIPVLLQLKDTLKLTPEQISQIEQISTNLEAKLAKRREDLGRRFDNVQGEQQGRVFQELQPQINESRSEVTAALKAVEKILTSDQWKQVPDRVKNPFQGAQPGQRGGRGRGG